MSDRFVLEDGDVEVESGTWDVTIEDDEEVRLVTTLNELRYYLAQQGMTLTEFMASEKARHMPDELRREVNGL